MLSLEDYLNLSMNINLVKDTIWKKILLNEFKKKYMKELTQFLISEKKTYTIFPSHDNIFNCLNLTPFNKIKVVILGQDPYHNEGQAHGLAFSVKSKIKIPPSLLNIFNEIKSDIQIKNDKNGNLTEWGKQGVLLLNSVLTVRKNEPASHQNKGWETFTDKIISIISDHKKGVVFMLWGKNANNKSHLIDTSKHHILSSSHPSPLSAYRGFLGSKHFSKCNYLLNKENKKEINWKII